MHADLLRSLLSVMVIATSVLCLPVFASAGDQRPSCVVLAFDAAKGADKATADALCNKLTVRLRDNGAWELISRADANQALLDNRFNLQFFPSLSHAAPAAGRMLGTDYVVFGTLTASAEGVSASVSVLEVAGGKVIQQVTTEHYESEESLLADAPAKLVALLELPAPAPTPIQPLPRDETPEQEPATHEPSTDAVAVTEPESQTPEKAHPKAAEPEPAPAAIEPVKASVTVMIPDAPQQTDPGLATWTKGLQYHLEIGTRITVPWLINPDQEELPGTMNELDVVQDFMPIKVCATWMFNHYWGIEANWDSVRANAFTATSDHHEDGDFVVSGPMLMAIGRYVTYSRLTPYAGIGIAYMSGSFDDQEWWHYGYPSKTEWINMGSPTYSMSGQVRYMEVENTIGFVAAGGLDYAIGRHFSADAFVRYMAVETKADYSIWDGVVMHNRGKYNVNMDNVAVGAGLKYVF